MDVERSRDDAPGLIDPSGRLFRGDDAVRAVADTDPPNLDTVGTQLARLGVTGVTDATPSRDITSIELIARAACCGALPQTVAVTGAPTLASHAEPSGVSWGPVKYVITDHELPTFEERAMPSRLRMRADDRSPFTVSLQRRSRSLLGRGATPEYSMATASSTGPSSLLPRPPRSPSSR